MGCLQTMTMCSVWDCCLQGALLGCLCRFAWARLGLSCLLEQVKNVYSKRKLDNMRLPFVNAKYFHSCGAKGCGSTWQPCSCRNLNLLDFHCPPAGILQPRGCSCGHDWAFLQNLKKHYVSWTSKRNRRFLLAANSGWREFHPTFFCSDRIALSCSQQMFV